MIGYRLVAMSLALLSGASMHYAPSYGGWGASFDFRTPNQRKRRRTNRQQGSKARRIKA